MTASSDLRTFLRKNRYAVLAAVAIAVIVIALLLFAATSLIPALSQRSALSAQLAQARQDLAQANQDQAETPATLQTQITNTQATLNEAANVFLTDLQAGGVINALYQYAQDGGVTIVSLENRSDPNQPTDQIYHVVTFQAQAQGSSHQLVGFVQRIKEASIASVIVDNLSITDGPVLDTLTLTIGLYVSSYSSGAVLPASSTAPPIVLPAVSTPAAPQPSVEAQLAQQLDSLWLAQNWPEVIRVLEQLQAINPSYPNLVEKLYAAHVNLGHQLVTAGRIEEAKAEFNRALAVNPNGGEASLALSQLSGGATAPPAQTTVYVVRPGDTLFSIARRHGISVNTLMAANGLVGSNIRVGQQLIIPAS